ncbi:MAG TPA: hypothetical protein VLA24_05390, partial [Pseudomonadales bacterium]|nr:hypothetical protein [Pseudomonadales bacterium]
YNIRIGDVEHIPCSEGAGNKLHGTKLNQEYLVVNGQASNWTTKQNTYHYNTAEGYSDALSDDAKIATLFEYGEQGAVYDCSDRSTMFQDNLGTTPITASGQTCGLHLDKSRGLVRGANVTLASTFEKTADGTLFTTLLNAAGNEGKWFEVTFNASVSSGGIIIRSTALSTAVSANVVVGANRAILPIVLSTGGISIGGVTTSRANVTDISVRELPGNHRYQPTLASRPQYIEDASGHYLLYDGDNDWMETNAVDFSGTDKMTVWWGGRKLSDASTGMLVELSQNGDIVNGAFYIASAISSGNNFRFNSRGTNPAGSTNSGHVAPLSAVVTGVGDIASPLARTRVNGVSTEVTLNQGTGNYGNHKLFFGRRNGTILPFNGREYMTIIRGA